jgi:predicted esterase
MLLPALLALAQIASPTPAHPEEPRSGVSKDRREPVGSEADRSSQSGGQRRLVSHPHPFALPDGAVGYVPASAVLSGSKGPPLLVLLHGAGHEQTTMVEHFEAEADMRGLVLLAPDSAGETWDVVESAKEPPSPDSPLANRLSHRFAASRDSRRVDAAIASLMKIVPIDRARTVLAGFSDGATFALAMGLSSSEHFAAVIAWSPGIAIRDVSPARGRRVFVSHGRQDPILKFDVTCGEIVPLLQSEGADVTFLPFDGGHDAPPPVKDAFLDAVFGRVVGSQALPLPASAAVCEAPGQREVPGY